MLRLLLNLILLPLRILGLFYYQILAPFRKGDHAFIEVPSRFSESRKSAILELISGREQGNIFYPFFLKHLLSILENPFIKRVSFNLGRIEFGYGELEEILRIIQKMNQKGIQTCGFALTGDLKTLFFLSYMKERYTSINSEFYPILPSAEVFFFKGLLKKLGVEVESFASGKHKSLGETFTRESFSPEARTNLESLLKSVKETLLTKLNENFPCNWEEVLTPILSGEKLLQIGFFKEVLDEEDFRENLAYKDYKKPQESKKKEDFTPISYSSILFFANKKRFKLLKKKKSTIAIVALHGEILEGRKEEQELKEGSIHAYPVINMLRELRQDSNIKAVVLEIDSPGGSAFASNLIYQEIKKLSMEKKVYAYMRNISASGGYFLACGCHKIYSHPLCITGSIGTVMLKPELSGLYKKLGITKERIGFYPKRDLLSESGKLSKETRDFLKHEIERVKNIFYSIVCENRKFSLKEMEIKGGGRVFSGRQGLELGLLDSLEGFLFLLQKIEEEIGEGELGWEYIMPVFSIRSLFRDWNFWKYKNPLQQVMSQFSRVESLYYSGFGFSIRSIL